MNIKKQTNKIWINTLEHLITNYRAHTYVNSLEKPILQSAPSPLLFGVHIHICTKLQQSHLITWMTLHSLLPCLMWHFAHFSLWTSRWVHHKCWRNNIHIRVPATQLAKPTQRQVISIAIYMAQSSQLQCNTITKIFVLNYREWIWKV